jgi:hypothetical protein
METGAEVPRFRHFRGPSHKLAQDGKLIFKAAEGPSEVHAFMEKTWAWAASVFSHDTPL